jgi:hypothetical protein
MNFALAARELWLIKLAEIISNTVFHVSELAELIGFRSKFLTCSYLDTVEITFQIKLRGRRQRLRPMPIGN